MKYLLVCIISVGLTFIYHIYRIRKVKKEILTSKISDVLYDILMLSFEKEAIAKSSKKIIKALEKNYDIDYCSILIYKDELEIIATNIEIEYQDEVEEYANEIFNSLKENKAQIRKSKSNTYLSYNTAREREIQYSYFVPLKNNEITLGALLIENKTSKMGRHEEDFFKTASNYITVAFQNLIYYDRIVALSITDSMTKTYNKGYLRNRLREEIEVQRNIGNTFNLVMVDLDNFKKINDKYGHMAGDKVLKEVAQIFMKNINNDEFVCRYGGEEFIIFLNSKKDAYKRVEEIRKELSKHVIFIDEDVPICVTGSFGIAEYPTQSKDIDKLIEIADEAAYYSKKNGKNRVYSELRSE